MTPIPTSHLNFNLALLTPTAIYSHMTMMTICEITVRNLDDLRCISRSGRRTHVNSNHGRDILDLLFTQSIVRRLGQ